MFSISLSTSVSLHPIFSQEGHKVLSLLKGRNNRLHPWDVQCVFSSLIILVNVAKLPPSRLIVVCVFYNYTI